MPETMKRLGAEQLAASTNTTIYQVPAGASAVANITICNPTSSVIAYRIAHTVNGTTVNSEDYIIYDRDIDNNYVHQFTGVTMGENDAIVAYSDTDNLIVKADGVEIT